MRMGLVCFIAMIFMASSCNTSAQETTACSIAEGISTACLKQFKDWFKAELDYRQYMDTNRNRVVYGAVTGNPQKHRKQRPTAPSWLSDYCAGTFQSDVSSDAVCPRYNAVKDYDWLSEQNHALLAQLIQKRESPSNTSFAQRIHLDVGYTAAQFPSPHVYGLIGMHVGLVPLGPCEINVLPGTMLLRIPEGNGSKLQPSVTIGGGGCRLTKFLIPGTRTYGVLHINLAQVHLIGQSSEQTMLGGSNLTLIGFSITMK